MPSTAVNPSVHVAVAVVLDAQGRCLLSKRPDHVHQGGKWEFPGGKVEAGESVQQALVRELEEELGITPTVCESLIRVPHDYGDKRVLLDVYRVTAYDGEACGMEGQELRWVELTRLPDYDFPAANRPIVDAARLPRGIWITPSWAPEDDVVAMVDTVLSSAPTPLWIQLRQKQWSESQLAMMVSKLLPIVHQQGGKLLLNGSSEWAIRWGMDGVQLDSKRLRATEVRPDIEWVFASCHTREDLQHAQRVADVAMLSPVLPTATHPDAVPLGWGEFQRMVESTAVPVYALGGMSPEHLNEAIKHGAQGVAAIRGWMP